MIILAGQDRKELHVFAELRRIRSAAFDSATGREATLSPQLPTEVLEDRNRRWLENLEQLPAGSFRKILAFS